MKKLTKSEMKMVFGGNVDWEEEEGGGNTGACLGCIDNSDCARVNKGTCDNCSTHGKKCCSGWHSHD